MNRADLLALTPDDLAAITNRGTVKRAQKELEEGSLSCVFREDAGEVTCEWSDGIVCRFPPGKSIHDALCSSGVVGISRHIIRSVLAYQGRSSETGKPAVAVPPEAVAGQAGQPETDSNPVAPSPAAHPAAADWDPGEISDDQLSARFRPATVSKARQRFQQGVLVELVRGPKPLARFLDEACTIRFMVPGDLRYVSADCSEALLGSFVPMAVWAFRQLEPGRRSGLVSVQHAESEVPTRLLDDLEGLLSDLCIDGMQGTSATWPQSLTRHEQACRDAGLTWPAELLADLLQQREMYASHDALFEPQAVVRLAGELLVRNRAIRHGATSVPQLLIRGSRSDRTTDLASSRMIGLGCGVRQSRRSVTITAFLQDTDAGGVVGVERTFADPAADSPDLPRDFAALSQTVISRGISLSTIGSGQLLMKSGKRTPGGKLILPRSTALSLNPQGFAWEHLRSPLAVEGLAELSARLDLLPPSCLRPRRLTEALHVCPVEAIEDVTFDIQSQRLLGVAVDPAGERAVLSHPFTTRGLEGFESLSAALADSSLKPRFVCGHVSRRQSGVWIEPICVVFENADGKRRGISPWTDARPAASTTHQDAARPDSQVSPLASVLNEISFELSELVLNGLRRAGATGARRWSHLATQVSRLGLVRLAERAARLSALLAEQAERTLWNPAAALAQTCELLMLARLADDIPPDA